jgi:hypothetical protein
MQYTTHIDKNGAPMLVGPRAEKIYITLAGQFQHSIEKSQKYYHLVSVVCYP